MERILGVVVLCGGFGEMWLLLELVEVFYDDGESSVMVYFDKTGNSLFIVVFYFLIIFPPLPIQMPHQIVRLSKAPLILRIILEILLRQFQLSHHIHYFFVCFASFFQLEEDGEAPEIA